jgi:hypothetical protein
MSEYERSKSRNEKGKFTTEGAENTELEEAYGYGVGSKRRGTIC